MPSTASSTGAHSTMAHRYQIHGNVTAIAGMSDNDAKVTVIVDADNDDEAQALAWQVCPGMDIEEIEHG